MADLTDTLERNRRKRRRIMILHMLQNHLAHLPGTFGRAWMGKTHRGTFLAEDLVTGIKCLNAFQKKYRERRL